MLTDQQYKALKADILADEALAGAVQSGDYAVIAAAYNQLADPAFIVWRTYVTQDEIMQTGFDWVRIDNLSVGKARIWEWLFANETRSINPSKANVRAGIAEVWKGTQADLAVQAAVLGHCRRAATRFEKLFAAGDGQNVGSTDNPAIMAVEGPLTPADASIAVANEWP